MVTAIYVLIALSETEGIFLHLFMVIARVFSLYAS